MIEMYAALKMWIAKVEGNAPQRKFFPRDPERAVLGTSYVQEFNNGPAFDKHRYAQIGDK